MSVDTALFTETLTKTGEQLQTKLGESQTMIQETLVSGVTTGISTGEDLISSGTEQINLAVTNSSQQALALGNNLSSSVEQNTSVIVEQALDNTINANLAGELLSSTEAITNAEVGNAVTETVSSTISSTITSTVDSSLDSAISSTINNSAEQSVNSSIAQTVEQSVASNVSEQINSAVALTVDNSVDNAINASSGLGI